MPDQTGAPTLGDLVAEIEDDIARADLTAQVRTAIARAIRHHQAERLGFNERTLSFVTVPGADVYGRGDLATIPDLYAVDTLVLIEADTIYPLARVPEAAIERQQNLSTGARPCRFSFFDRSLRLDPVPDAEYVLRVTGHVCIPAPQADDDTSPWVNEASSLIAAWAKRHLAMNALRDPVLAAAQGVLVAEAFRTLLGRTNRAASSGVIRAHDL